MFFKRPRSSGDVVMLDIHDVRTLDCSPFDGGIDVVDDVPIVLGDVVLDVDNDKCFIVHLIHVLLSSKILFCLGTVLPDSANLSAGVLVRAIGTGFIALGGYTLMHLAQMTAEVELGSFCSATCTIDTLWCNLIGVIHLALIS